MTNLLKSLIPYRFKRAVKDHLGVPSLHRSLLLLKNKGFHPAAALDIGAYKGLWTLDFLEVFPGTKILMVEAQRQKEPFLKAVSAKNDGVEYVIGLLSSESEKNVSFLEDETASHVDMRKASVPDRQNMRLTSTLDSVVKDTVFQSPQFIKLDVQGHELEVLRGAANSLAAAEICLLEVTVLDLGDESPLLAEVIKFMAHNDFLLYDITQLMRRPYDDALFQMDVMFIRASSSLIQDKRWN